MWLHDSSEIGYSFGFIFRALILDTHRNTQRTLTFDAVLLQKDVCLEFFESNPIVSSFHLVVQNKTHELFFFISFSGISCSSLTGTSGAYMIRKK